MNVILAYLVGLLTGAVFTYGILATQRKPPTTRTTEPLPKIVVEMEEFLRTL